MAARSDSTVKTPSPADLTSRDGDFETATTYYEHYQYDINNEG